MSRVSRIRNRNNNLVHSRTEVQKDPRKKTTPLLIFSLVLILGAAYLLFFSDLLVVSDVSVEGYSHPETVKEIVESELSQSPVTRSILFFNNKKIKSTLTGDPRIKEVNIRRQYPNKILINIKEEASAIIWVTAGEKYLISGRGEVMGLSQGEDLPVIYDSANIKINPGEKVASPTFINFINDLNQKFEPAVSRKINKIIIFDLLTDVHVLTDANWTVYFNGTKDLETQLKNLNRVLEEVEKTGHKNLQYIDMRLDNKIFYK